jgi:hypothetical protein
MANTNISENDFKIARKMNAVLSNCSRSFPFARRMPISWEEMPSTLPANEVENMKDLYVD